MEVFKFILTNYGPAVAACCLMVYLCFFTKKSISGDEKKLKNDLAQVLRENAELKVQLNKAMDKVNEKVDSLNTKVNELLEESEEDEPNNSNA